MSNIALRVEPYFCSEIHQVAEDAVKLADSMRIPVVFTLDGIELYAHPGTSVRAMDRTFELVTQYEEQTRLRTQKGRFEAAVARADHRR